MTASNRLAPALVAVGLTPDQADRVTTEKSVSNIYWGTAIVAAYLAAAYFVIYKLLPSNVSADVYLYVAQPLIWSGLGFLSLFLWRRLPDRPAPRPFFIALAVIAGLFQLSFLVVAGLLFGFGHSPFTGPVLFMAKNGVYLITLIVGLEMSRAYLLHGWGRINTPLAFVIVALLFAAVTIAPAQFELPAGREAGLQTTGTIFLPAMTDSLVATFLASFGGPLVAISYMVVLHAFEWFSPILPNLDWTMNAFVRTLGPLIAMLITRDILASWTAPEDAEEEEGGLSPVWMVGGVLVVAAIWLNAGMLGVQPSMMSGRSMEPALDPYDIVFSKVVDPADLEVGDIIRYVRNGVPIIHRIVEIPDHLEGQLYAAAEGPIVAPEGSSGPLFIVQGDQNNVADPPVDASQIKGKVVFTIPKVGWAIGGIREALGRLR